MPINHVQIRQAIRSAAQQAPQRALETRQRRENAQRLLQQAVDEPLLLAERLQTALANIPELRTALPSAYPLNACFTETQNHPPVTLWAADGSQIIPDPHLAIQFGVINVGTVRMAAGQKPRQAIESKLLYDNELYNPQGNLLGEEVIALRRDYQERSILLQSAQSEPGPVLTLTDGPLELYREGRESREYQEMLEKYIETLLLMAEKRILTAGYVDKPRSDLVIRLLELLDLNPEQLPQAGRIRPLIGISDAEIFSGILQPGERSAAFGLNARPGQYFQGPLAIHFFYLNTGRSGKAHIVRVEIPAWVAQDEQSLQRIQNVVLDQCRQMGSKSYPYILHRAHEIAMVTYQERQLLLELLQIELLNHGQPGGETSNKQQLKNLAGKSRHA